MANEYQVQSPLLRMLLFLYSYMGIQLAPVHLHQWRSVLVLCWNLLFVLSILYALVTQDPMGMGSLITSCQTHKPLFAYFVQLGAKFTYPSAFLVGVSYFWLFGRKILVMLDSPCFSSFYHSTSQAKAIFAVLAVSNQIFYLVWMLDKVKVHQLQRWPSPHELLNYLTVFVICSFTYSSCFILHYYQYATYRLLKRVEAKVSVHHLSVLTEKAALQEIKTLALVNYQLNQLTSFPWISYLFLNVFNTITIVCMALICQPDYGLMLQVGCTALYIGYLASLNHKTLETFGSIVETLRKHHGKTNDLTSRQPNQNVQWRRSPREMDITEMARESRQIRLDQIDLYGEYFAIQIFQLGCINFPFLLQTVLFILCYVVFLSQTN